MSALLRLLGGALGPYLVAFLAVIVLGLASGLCVQTWRLHSAQVTVAEAEVHVAQVGVDLRRAQDNRMTCQGRLRAQAAKIQELADQAARRHSIAVSRAKTVLARPMAPQPDSDDARGMNQWLASVLSSSR